MLLYPASCIHQYKSSGSSRSIPVLGSTANPKDSKVTTPIKTLSIMSEIQIGLVFSRPRIFIQTLAPFTFISPVISFSFGKSNRSIQLGIFP
jgi:hypothetical protein